MLYFTQIKAQNHIVSFLFFLFSCFGFSQEVQVDPNFNSYDNGLLGDGFDGTVRTLSLQNDGKLIVGGEFLNYNGTATSYLCRLQKDGSKDAGFNLGTGFNGKIYTSLVQLDGRVIVAGSFTSYNGSPVGRIIRLNSNGSMDTSFDTSVAANSGTIYGLALQSDGKLIVVGSFTKYNGITVNRIVRLSSNGELDAGFVTGTAANSTIDDVAIASDNKIMLSGTFSSFNGNTNYSKLVRLNSDGSIDSNFSIGTGFDDTIEAIAIQSDGKIIVAGSFLNYNGTSQSRILRLKINGTVDTEFDTGTGFNNGVVHAIQISSSGILLGGSFSNKYKATNVNRLVLLNSNGTINPNFNIGEGPSTATVYALTASLDSFFVGGSFSIFNELTQGRLAKISTVGELDSNYLLAGVGFDNAVDKLIPLSDGSFITYGSFTQFNGKQVNRIVKLTASGDIDINFNSGQSGANNTVKEVLALPDGKLLVAGNFTKYNEISVNRLVRLHSNGNIDPSFNVGIGFSAMVYSIVFQNDGKIIVAGNFSKYKGVTVNKVIRLFPNGDLDTSFNIGTNPNDTPNLLLVQSNGKLLVAGDFSTFNGVVTNKLVRLNTEGSVDSSFATGTGFIGIIYSMTLQNDGKILVGGSLSKYNGQTIGKIIRLNSNGTSDSTFNSGSGFSGGIVRSILAQANGNILIGGSFSGKYNGIVAKRMVRLLPNGTYDTSFPITLNGEVKTLCLVKGGAVIGGDFNSVLGIPKHRIAKLLFCQEGTIWNGTTWSNGMPTVDKTVVFNASYDITTNTKLCSCVVNPGITVTVKNGATLELGSNYTAAGSLVFESNSSLLQEEGTTPNTANIQFKRRTTPIRKMDYTYWSSPVVNQQLKALSPDSPSDRFYSFDANFNNWKRESTNSIMGLGKGYIFQAPQNFSETISSVFEATFLGIPNNGLVTIPITKNQTLHLIGNPYPSAIDADAFIMENQGLLQGGLYFWTHNTSIVDSQYSSDDYAVYTILGGIGTAAKNSGINNTIPNGKIASGQAFFVLGTNQQGNIIFKNAMRIKGDNNMFFKSNVTKTVASSDFEKHRIWLNLSNQKGVFKQILVGYSTGATNGKDALFDGVSLDSNEWLDFYSENEGFKNTIQARALPFDSTDSVSIGYRAKLGGDYSIRLDNFDGLFTNQNIFLEDKQEAKIHDLKKGEYSFSTVKGAFDNRFVVRYQIKNTVPKESPAGVHIVTRTNQIQISSYKDKINQVFLYSLEGKQLYLANKLETKIHFIDTALWKAKVLIVQITLETGEKISRKVLF